jgi:hypothetical protein
MLNQPLFLSWDKFSEEIKTVNRISSEKSIGLGKTEILIQTLSEKIFTKREEILPCKN